MTENPSHDPEDLNSGRPVGLFIFLTLAVQRGDIPQAQGTNLRVGARKVLDVEENDDVDLRAVDLDDLVRRFHIKSKVDLKDESRASYEKRFRTAVEMYTKYLSDDPSWKPTASARKAKSTTSSGKRTTPTPAPELVPDVAPVTLLPGAHLMEFPVPLRRGVVAKMYLPTDLTDLEAKRIGDVAKALAGGEQLSLPPGETD